MDRLGDILLLNVTDVTVTRLMNNLNSSILIDVLIQDPKMYSEPISEISKISLRTL